MSWTIKKILTGNKIELNQNWFWQGHEGNVVYVEGYRVPEEGYGSTFGREKLERMLKDEPFELYAPKFWDAYGKKILVCRVYIKEVVDISHLFPEFGGGR